MILFFFSIINGFITLHNFLIFFWFYTNYFEAEDIWNYFTLKKDNIYGIHIDYNNVILSGYNCLTFKKDNIYGIHIDYNNGILPGYNCRINMR